jgi:hypothetical protein
MNDYGLTVLLLGYIVGMIGLHAVAERRHQ